MFSQLVLGWYKCHRTLKRKRKKKRTNFSLAFWGILCNWMIREFWSFLFLDHWKCFICNYIYIFNYKITVLNRLPHNLFTYWFFFLLPAFQYVFCILSQGVKKKDSSMTWLRLWNSSLLTVVLSEEVCYSVSLLPQSKWETSDKKQRSHLPFISVFHWQCTNSFAFEMASLTS